MTCASLLRAASAALALGLASAAQAAPPVSAGGLLGTRIATPAGERLGTLRDLAVDVAAGEVAYAVVDLNDPSALDSSLKAVPLEALRPGLARDQLVLDASSEAPWRGKELPLAAEDARLIRLTTLIGMQVEHPTGADYGRIVDLEVDLASARVPRAVVRLDAGTADPKREVPFQALRFPPGDAALLTLR